MVGDEDGTRTKQFLWRYNNGKKVALISKLRSILTMAWVLFLVYPSFCSERSDVTTVDLRYIGRGPLRRKGTKFLVSVLPIPPFLCSSTVQKAQPTHHCHQPMTSQPTIPWAALLPLLVGRFSASAVYACPFPFLPSMLTSMGLPIQRAAFWTGFAESALMMGEFVTAIPISRLSDRLGRRPIIIGSMLWSAVTCVMLGTSSNVVEVVLWRLLGGINGMRQVGRVVLGELSNEHNRVRMFSAFTPAGTAGTIVGRLIGGAFAEPQKRLPWIGEVKLFQLRPYLLPLLIMAICPMVGFFLSLKYTKETKPAELCSPGAKPTLQRAIKQPGMLPLLLAFTIGQSLDHASAAATTLIASVSVEDGGLGLTLLEISLLLAGMSAAYIVLAPVCLHLLSRRYTKHQSLTLLTYVWLLLAPLYSTIVHHARSNRTLLKFDLALLAVVRSVSGSCWAFYDIVAIETSSATLLSSTNACITLFGSLGRVAGPVLFGWIYSRSLAFSPGAAERQLVWISLFVVCLLPLPLLWMSGRQQRRWKEDIMGETQPYSFVTMPASNPYRSSTPQEPAPQIVKAPWPV